MTDYLETPGRTSLKEFVDANQGSVNAYIRQFDKATDATKKSSKKICSSFQIKAPQSKEKPRHQIRHRRSMDSDPGRKSRKYSNRTCLSCSIESRW